ncbi:23241_t:CDS:2, partial [Dentiscutata erythropus]
RDIDSNHSPTKTKNVVKEGNNSPVNSDSEYVDASDHQPHQPYPLDIRGSIYDDKYGEYVKITFHVHLPAYIERHGEPVIVGNCKELGSWGTITIKLTQPYKREYPTYWRSHTVDIKLGRYEIRYRYGIFNQGTVDYEGESDRQYRILDIRTNDRYDIWQKNSRYNILGLREYAFTKCIYDAVNTENLKDKVMQFQLLLENHKDRDPPELIFQLPTNFHSDTLLEALENVQEDTFTSDIKPIMAPVVAALVRHNAIKKFLDPRYTFVEGFIGERYNKEQISQLLKEWPRLVKPYLYQVEEHICIKIAKWLISLCSNLEILNIVWHDSIHRILNIDDEIETDVSASLYRISAQNNA